MAPPKAASSLNKRKRAVSADGASSKGINNSKFGKFLRPKLQPNSQKGTKSYEIDVVDYTEDDLRKKAG